MNAYLETRTYKSGFPVTSFRKQNNSFRAHWHLEVEMVYVCEGSIRICINRELRTLHKGEMAIIRSTDIHYYDGSDGDSTVNILIFRSELIGCPGGWPEARCFTPPFIDEKAMGALAEKVGETVRDTFGTILEELDGQQDQYRQIVVGKLCELCALCLRHFPNTDSHAKLESGRHHDVKKMQMAIGYLEQNFREDVTLLSAAEAAGFSPCYFSRLFSKFTGLTFKAYLNKLRLDAAERLLKTQDASVIDISLECGFGSVRTFNRQFKSAKGVTPTATKITGA